MKPLWWYLLGVFIGAVGVGIFTGIVLGKAWNKIHELQREPYCDNCRTEWNK